MKKAFFSSAIAAIALTAMVGTSATAQSAPKDDPLKEMDEFMAVYKRVKASYVDKVDDKQLMEARSRACSTRSIRTAPFSTKATSRACKHRLTANMADSGCP